MNAKYFVSPLFLENFHHRIGPRGPRGPPGPAGPPGPGLDISGLPENAILWVENDVIKGNPCMTFDTSNCTINISGGIVFEPNISNPNSGIFSGSTLWVDSSGCLNLGTQNLCKGPTGSIIGIERVTSSNGNPVGPFLRLAPGITGTRVWSARGTGTTGSNAPFLNTVTDILAPVGSTTSYVTIIPGASGPGPAPSAFSDTIVCSKYIRNIRFYTELQFSTTNTASWRTVLFLNGVFTNFGFGSSGNNTVNQRVFSVMESGGIPPFTLITFQIQQVTGVLPVSIQNANSYCIIEYDI
jgi:hypothetical protein